MMDLTISFFLRKLIKLRVFSFETNLESLVFEDGEYHKYQYTFAN